MIDTPNSKVVIFVTYKTSFVILKEHSEKYGVSILNGSVPMKKRDGIVATFQAPNNDVRVIICHPIVGGVGLSLDDQHGGFPRHVFIMPSYNFIDLYQACGRVDRSLTKSVPYIRFVYVLGAELEMMIINALARKSAVSRNASQSTEVYPGEFESYSESHILEILFSAFEQMKEDSKGDESG